MVSLLVYKFVCASDLLWFIKNKSIYGMCVNINVCVQRKYFFFVFIIAHTHTQK